MLRSSRRPLRCSSIRPVTFTAGNKLSKSPSARNTKPAKHFQQQNRIDKPAVELDKFNTAVKFKQIPLRSDRFERYVKAVRKIFKNMDLFNRGKISQTNITKWVSESALYFLGAVFQNIRQQRLTLDEQGFIERCKSIFEISSVDDIDFFIDDALGFIETVNKQQTKREAELPESRVETKIQFVKQDIGIIKRDALKQRNEDNHRLKQQEKDCIVDIYQQSAARHRRLQESPPRAVPYAAVIRKNTPRKQYNPEGRRLQYTMNESSCNFSVQVDFADLIENNKEKAGLGSSLKIAESPRDVKESSRGEGQRLDRLADKLQWCIKQNLERIEKSKDCSRQCR